MYLTFRNNVLCNIDFIANWAQSSGPLLQNTVIPYLPNDANPHWNPRYGMVSVAMVRIIKIYDVKQKSYCLSIANF